MGDERINRSTTPKKFFHSRQTGGFPFRHYLGGVKSQLENCSLYAYEGVDGVLKSKEVLTKNLPDGVVRRIILKIEKHVQIQTGDKLTGRHGNKGVVSAILPESQMPYFFAETTTCTDKNCPVERPHTHLDALLNPLGITGRMNVGQLYETALGWIAKNKGGITVEPFNREWSFEKIQSVMADMNLRSKQKVYFYEAGTEIEAGDITVGYQYMMKLSHLAENKLTVLSQNTHKYDRKFGQPRVSRTQSTDIVSIWKNRKAKKRNPQRIGEMELWALQGHSAWNMIDEFLFLKSDAKETQSDFACYIRSGIIDENSCLTDKQRQYHAIKTLAHYCRGMGLEMEFTDTNNGLIDIFNTHNCPEIQGIQFRFAKDSEREAWANNQEVRNTGTEDDGLWSKAIFGDETNFKDSKLTNAYGIIRLPKPLLNPLFMVIKKFLQNEKLLNDFFANNKQAQKADIYDLTLIPHVGNISDTCFALERVGYKPSDIFMKTVLVLPKNLRDEMDNLSIKGKNIAYNNDLNQLYKRLIGLAVHSKSNIKIKSAVYALMVNGKIKIPHLNIPLSKRFSGASRNSILATITGYKRSKDGIIRKNLLGKRVNFSGRAVIVPDPNLGLDEAGLPRAMLKALSPSGCGAPQFIVLNRAPSLHRLSMMAFRPIAYDEGYDRKIQLASILLSTKTTRIFFGSDRYPRSFS